MKIKITEKKKKNCLSHDEYKTFKGKVKCGSYHNQNIIIPKTRWEDTATLIAKNKTPGCGIYPYLY